MVFSELPGMIVAVSVFGGFVVVPMTMMLLRHQRQMAKALKGNASDETLKRLEAIERQLSEMRAAQNMQIITDDDERSSLRS
ncbi:MAG TPA: hypothetical protein VNI20_01340 [Fimbriimonadaceae bacterium]|nr:hypothetical protein [Fimbriimonadaceae bacterium]